MTSINNNINNTPQESNTTYYYKRRSPIASDVGVLAATVATGLIYKALPSFSNPFLKQITKEHANNHIYKDAFLKAIENSKLEEKGLKLIHTEHPETSYGQGLNACFSPQTKEIILNTKKACISGFHELGHAINNMGSGIGKIMQKLRGPGYTVAAIMGSVALFTRTKPKEAEKNLFDIVQDNCGKIAFISMLPTVIEEAMASKKGIDMAKRAGLGESAIKNLRKFYGKALLSYAGYAALTGFSVFVTSKIMEIFTRPKKVSI